MNAKDYFQDITPPESSAPRTLHVSAAMPETTPADQSPSEGGEKSIRNIQVPTRLRRSPDVRESDIPPLPRRRERMWLWGGAALALLILGVLALVALRPTTVTVIPRSHTVFFDETARFIAYPAGSNATGTLSFMIEESTYEDSQIVKAAGVERVEERASGNITVYNDYSSTPVKLLKNTRFETPDGLIFRAPSEVVVPGKKGSAAGEVTVMVIADAPGDRYNVGPVSRFTLPGLKSSTMYTKVYARSSAAMSGGFSGERPVAEKSALDAAVSEIRGRLEEKAHAAIGGIGADKVAFFDLARLSYESLPATMEGQGNVRIAERLRLELPVFPADAFAHVVAESVSAGAEEGGVVLKPLEGFSARAETKTFSVTSPLTFTLSGQAQLVWKVNVDELASALAGRDESAFQTIVESFSGIEEAHARIEPFWSNSFPKDTAAIKMKVKEPEPAR